MILQGSPPKKGRPFCINKKTTYIFAFKTIIMTELEKYRENIDRIDKQLINLMAERFRYSAQIGAIKKSEGLSVLQSERWDEIISSRREYAAKAGLSEKFTGEIFQHIHDESIRIQQEIAGR